MKKPLILLLSFCYLLVACGFTINKHYCGGHLKKVSLLKITEEGCCGSEEESSGCCDDESEVFKIKDNHKLDATPKVNNTTFLIAVVITYVLSDLTTINDESSIINYHAPPVLYDNPIYLKYQVFLI